MHSMICIYCLQEKEPSREHIIPQAFGTFGEKGVINCVCKDCNNTLGREIDFVLARDTLEGQTRNQFGKFSSEKTQTQRIRNTIKEGELKGFSVILDQTTGRSQPENQIKVRNIITGEYACLTLRELKKIGEEKNNYDLEPSKIGIIAHADQIDKFISELEKMGISLGERKFNSIAELFGNQNPSEDEVFYVPVKNQGRIDTKVMRAISKIVYNFCAKEYGEEFVRGKEFDEIRDFITGRSTTIPGFVPINEKDGLEDTTPLIKEIMVEIFTNETGVQGKVTFWGVFSYTILITRDLLKIKPFVFKETPRL